MKILVKFLSLLALATTGLTAPASDVAYSSKPINCDALNLLRSNLLEKARTLESFAYSTVERNRVISSPGHNTTINWIKNTLEKCSDYYTIELQPFHLTAAVSANLTVNGPGINDNGSGTISILEIAAQLASFRVLNVVRFSWWSAEEEGLLGASYYVSQLPASERSKIRLFLDFDMMASPNYAYQIYDRDGSSYGESGLPGSGEVGGGVSAVFRGGCGIEFHGYCV